MNNILAQYLDEPLTLLSIRCSSLNEPLSIRCSFHSLTRFFDPLSHIWLI
jgi:hypothetical protein